jgi:hypothetical protein
VKLPSGLQPAVRFNTALPADLTSKLAQYDATEPVSASSTTTTTTTTTTTDAGRIAPGTVEADAFLSSLQANTLKYEAHRWTAVTQTPPPPGPSVFDESVV